MASNLRILRIQNTKFSGYHFYMNTNIKGDFQICISVPLNLEMCAHIFVLMVAFAKKNNNNNNNNTELKFSVKLCNQEKSNGSSTFSSKRHADAF